MTKSSIFLVTRNAGSVIVSGPTRTCPCSTKVTASLTVSDIFNRHMTIGSLRLQKADTVTLLQSENLAVEVMMAMEYNLSKRAFSFCARNGSRGSRSDIRLASCLMLPANLLYLEEGSGIISLSDPFPLTWGFLLYMTMATRMC